VSALRLRRAGRDDLAFVQATERRPGYERSVGRWELPRHEAELASAANAYLIGEEMGEPVAFAILRGLDDASGNRLLQRVAVARPGQGVGRRFLREVIRFAFALPATHRVWLDVFESNERARHLYRSLGLREDGLFREAYLTAGGERVTLVLMSILRREWEASATD
jgi:RimJ/RimL family protein N-acetyltransferase